MFKFGLGYVTKLPRFVICISMFITLFLQVFLFLACLNSSSTFSSVYLVKFEYDSDSKFFKAISESYKENNASAVADMEVTTGFLSICGSTKGNSDLKCVPRHDTSQLQKFVPLSIYQGDKHDSGSDAVVDPLKLATKFTTNSVNPYFIILTVVLVTLAMFSTLWTASSSLPKQSLVSRLSMITTLLAWISCTVGAIWLEVACNTVSDLAHEASATVLSASKGTRASAMNWTSFTFLLISLIMAFVVRLKKRRIEAESKV